MDGFSVLYAYTNDRLAIYKELLVDTNGHYYFIRSKIIDGYLTMYIGTDYLSAKRYFRESYEYQVAKRNCMKVWKK